MQMAMAMLSRVSGKKDFLAGFLYRTRVLSAIRFARRHVLRQVPVLSYHRVVTLDDSDSYPFDSALISATEEEFDWQVRFVSEYYEPITFRDVIEANATGSPLPERALIITFDDGFDDNYTNAFRILKSYKVPAVFFVSTGYLDSDTTYWFDWLAFQLARIESGKLEIPAIGYAAELDSDLANRNAAYLDVVGRLKHVGNAVRLDALSGMAESYGDQYALAPDEVKALSRPMSWDQVTEMSEWGMEIGSHAVTHPILSSLTPGELRAELEDSHSAIGERLATSPVTIAYPNGQYEDFNDQVIAMARSAGYQIGVAHVSGRNTIRQTNSFAVRRVHIGRGMSRARFATELAIPEL